MLISLAVGRYNAVGLSGGGVIINNGNNNVRYHPGAYLDIDHKQLDRGGVTG